MNQAQIPPTVSFSAKKKPPTSQRPGTGGGRLFSLEPLCSKTSVLQALGSERSLVPSLLILFKKKFAAPFKYSFQRALVDSSSSSPLWEDPCHHMKGRFNTL